MVVVMTTNNRVTPPPPPDSYYENGRYYHTYRKGLYMYPCDESEQKRMDMLHELFLVARRRELHTAHIENQRNPRILDLGTGTGIWAIDMADKFKDAEVSITSDSRCFCPEMHTYFQIFQKVIGVDLVNIQPAQIPPRLRFRVPVDYESPWTFGEDSWDLVHLRLACGSVQSWPELYQKIFRHLIPGTGCIEQVEIDLRPRCDDGTLPDIAFQWYKYLEDATNLACRPIAYQTNTRQMLETAGFIDIQEQVIRAPYNSWPADPRMREIGRWYCATMLEGLEAMSMAPLTRINRWSSHHVTPLTDDMKRVVKSKKAHGYNNIHIWTARRPLN